jgi:hypothetical protein
MKLGPQLKKTAADTLKGNDIQENNCDVESEFH